MPSFPNRGKHTPGISQEPAVNAWPVAVVGGDFLTWPHQGQTLGARDSATRVGKMPHDIF